MEYKAFQSPITEHASVSVPVLGLETISDFQTTFSLSKAVTYKVQFMIWSLFFWKFEQNLREITLCTARFPGDTVANRIAWQADGRNRVQKNDRRFAVNNDLLKKWPRPEKSMSTCFTQQFTLSNKQSGTTSLLKTEKQVAPQVSSVKMHNQKNPAWKNLHCRRDETMFQISHQNA